MKRLLIVYIFLFLLVISNCINAQKVINNNNPKLVFENTSYDYGTIIASSDGKAVFKFKNEGKAPLTISNVDASCGCTSVDWPEKSLATGEEGVITINYNTNIVGPIKRSVTVSSNDPNNSRVVLVIIGKVEKSLNN